MLDSLHKDALKALRAEKIGVLATSSQTGSPWTAALHFLVDDAFNFYFLTRKSTQKAKDIGSGADVALNVGLFCQGKNGNFQIAGRGSRLDVDDWAKFMTSLFSQREVNDLHMDAKKDDPFFGMGGHDYVLLILKPTFVRWLRITKGKSTFTVVLPS